MMNYGAMVDLIYPPEDKDARPQLTIEEQEDIAHKVLKATSYKKYLQR